jgi:hypothetical protein
MGDPSLSNALALALRVEGARQTARRNPALPEADGSARDDQSLLSRPSFMWPPEPREGRQDNSPGKAAEAAALGKPPTQPNLFFQSGLARLGRAKPDWKKRGNHFLSLTQGGARSSLALGYYHYVLAGLQFGSLRLRLRRTVPVSAA